MSGWRHRYSAVANRSALPSDYYSEKKITVTPLNFVCKCRAPLAARCASRSSAERRCERLLRRRGCTAKISDRAEVPMECAFLRRIMLRCRVENARIAAHPRARFRARRRRRSEIHHAKKILRRTPSAGLLTARARRKTRKSSLNRFARRGVRGGARTWRGVTPARFSPAGPIARSAVGPCS